LFPTPTNQADKDIMILINILLLLTGISAWQITPGLQRIFRGSTPSISPVRFEKGSKCETFIKELSSRHSIVYNYGLNENNTGARELVDCLASQDGVEARSNVHNIYVALPFVGDPEPKQKAFAELIGLLPKLKTIRYSVEFLGGFMLITL
jgi:hypothetical protein